MARPDDRLLSEQGVEPMIWTTNPPTAPGYYWLSIGGRLGHPQVVRVYRTDRITGGLGVRYAGLTNRDQLGDGRIEEQECWWAGPIALPTEHGRCASCGHANKPDGCCSRPGCCDSD